MRVRPVITSPATIRSLATLTTLTTVLLQFSACEGCFNVGGTPDAGPSGEGEGEGEGEAPVPTVVSINELMASNSRTFADSTGAFPDWVELRNLEATAKSVGQFVLTDDPDAPEKFRLPAGATIPAGGYLIIFCDDDVAQSTAAEPHAPFKLSSSGESLLLFDADGVQLDRVDFPALGSDQSYGRLPDGNGDLQVLPNPSPTLPNEALFDAGVPPDAGCDPPFVFPPLLVVNEVLVDNQSDLIDGVASPWIELFNAGATGIPLARLVLSDDDQLAATAPLPAAVTLAPGDWLVLIADGAAAPGHTTLSLSAADTHVAVGDVCGTVFHALPLAGGGTDTSVGLMPDGTTAAVQALTPTRGTANAP